MNEDQTSRLSSILAVNRTVANEVAVSNQETAEIVGGATEAEIQEAYQMNQSATPTDEELQEAYEMDDDHEAKTSIFSPLFSVLGDGGNAVQLQMTGQLTQIASEIANVVFMAAASNGKEYESKVQASFKSHDAMDDLINELYNLADVDVEFLKSETTENLEKMVRSQQSKRSRMKGMAMNINNYKKMLVGAVAENLLRIVMDKPKNSGGGSKTGILGLSEEDIKHLIDFPEDLTKAIRNVQSKKSIAKSKADYNPLGARWLSLMAEEQQLKSLRDSKQQPDPGAIKALETALKVEEQLTSEDVEALSPEDAKALLVSLKEMLTANNLI